MSEKLLEIICYPDPFLSRPARPITGEEIRAGVADGWKLNNLAERMIATMFAADGIGLAATQVRVGLRLFVMSLPENQAENIKPQVSSREPLVFLNPVLSELRGSAVEEEGCLSVPEVRAKVKRAASIKITGLNLKGQPLAYDCSALVARACQHEVDHLNGILFINKVGMAARLMIRQRLAELEASYEEGLAKK